MRPENKSSGICGIAGMKLTAYSQHCLGSFLPSLGRLAQPSLLGARSRRLHLAATPRAVHVIFRPHLSTSVPHFGQVYPPHKACWTDFGVRICGSSVLQHGHCTSSRFIPHLFLLIVPLTMAISAAPTTVARTSSSTLRRVAFRKYVVDHTTAAITTAIKFRPTSARLRPRAGPLALESSVGPRTL